MYSMLVGKLFKACGTTGLIIFGHMYVIFIMSNKFKQLKGIISLFSLIRDRVLQIKIRVD